MQEVLSVSKKVGKAAGKHCVSGAEVTMRIGQGFQYLALSSEAGLMAKAARAEFGDIDLSGKGETGDATGSLY
jgi:2-keto-3-deoxy-L-rhamnonate aldolase RhmA